MPPWECETQNYQNIPGNNTKRNRPFSIRSSYIHRRTVCIRHNKRWNSFQSASLHHFLVVSSHAFFFFIPFVFLSFSLRYFVYFLFLFLCQCSKLNKNTNWFSVVVILCGKMLILRREIKKKKKRRGKTPSRNKLCIGIWIWIWIDLCYGKNVQYLLLMQVRQSIFFLYLTFVLYWMVFFHFSRSP